MMCQRCLRFVERKILQFPNFAESFPSSRAPAATAENFEPKFSYGDPKRRKLQLKIDAKDRAQLANAG